MDKKSIEGLSFNFNITINKHKYHIINYIIGEIRKPTYKEEDTDYLYKIAVRNFNHLVD